MHASRGGGGGTFTVAVMRPGAHGQPRWALRHDELALRRSRDALRSAVRGAVLDLLVRAQAALAAEEAPARWAQQEPCTRPPGADRQPFSS